MRDITTRNMNNNDINKISCRVMNESKYLGIVQHVSSNDGRVTFVNDAQKQALVTEYIKLLMQLNVLKNIANEYPGKTIENIIVQMEARLKETGVTTVKVKERKEAGDD